MDGLANRLVILLLPLTLLNGCGSTGTAITPVKGTWASAAKSFPQTTDNMFLVEFNGGNLTTQLDPVGIAILDVALSTMDLSTDVVVGVRIVDPFWRTKDPKSLSFSIFVVNAQDPVAFPIAAILWVGPSGERQATADTAQAVLAAVTYR
jgi:hypothetical protein